MGEIPNFCEFVMFNLISMLLYTCKLIKDKVFSIHRQGFYYMITSKTYQLALADALISCQSTTRNHLNQFLCLQVHLDPILWPLRNNMLDKPPQI